jgi:hypothetical protein
MSGSGSTIFAVLSDGASGPDLEAGPEDAATPFGPSAICRRDSWIVSDCLNIALVMAKRIRRGCTTRIGRPAPGQSRRPAKPEEERKKERLQ